MVSPLHTNVVSWWVSILQCRFKLSFKEDEEEKKKKRGVGGGEVIRNQGVQHGVLSYQKSICEEDSTSGRGTSSNLALTAVREMRLGLTGSR